MSATLLDDVLVDRPGAAQDITKIIQTIMADERSRRRWQTMLTVGPWVVSAVFGLYALGAGIVMSHRPVPIPQVEIAIYRSDGSVEAPVERNNLSTDRKAFIRRADLQQFIVAWESYNWLANQSYYNRVSAMTSGERLQTAYQESWRKRNDPDNREVKYGQATTRNVMQIHTSFVQGSPGALSARFEIKTTTQAGSSCEWWAASLTFRQDNNGIPLDLQLAYDPSDVVVVTYSSTPADTGARPFPC